MSETGLVQILEGALLAAGKALTVAQLADLFEEHERPDNAAIREALKEVSERCEERGFELLEVASGFRFQVRQNLSPWVARLWVERPQKYSRALLETLALVAYRQPITRGEIEEIRGVAVSSNIIKTLHEREWVRVVGHRDVPGRPAMYATTKQFLDYFSLKSLDQLPALAEIRDLETLNAELGFSEPLPEDATGPKEGTPELTVVGGTEHVPAQEAEVEVVEGSAEQSIEASIAEAASAETLGSSESAESAEITNAAGDATETEDADIFAAPDDYLAEDAAEDSVGEAVEGIADDITQDITQDRAQDRAEDQGISLAEAAEELQARAQDGFEDDVPAEDSLDAVAENSEPAPGYSGPDSATPESKG